MALTSLTFYCDRLDFNFIWIFFSATPVTSIDVTRAETVVIGNGNVVNVPAGNFGESMQT